jgi:hypothetical protein
MSTSKIYIARMNFKTLKCSSPPLESRAPVPYSGSTVRKLSKPLSNTERRDKTGEPAHRSHGSSSGNRFHGSVRHEPGQEKKSTRRSGASTSAIPRETARRLESLAPSAESLAALEFLRGAVDEASPLSARHRAALKKSIRGLWEDLTSERESRSVDYLGASAALSAYLRYFMPWNVFRLTSLFSNADLCLPEGAVIADLGSGPLTVPIALWASRPELREVPLTIYCMDRVERALETGLAVFETLCMRAAGRLPPWRIVLRKFSFGSPLPEKVQLVTAANLFNEFFWRDKRNLGERALAAAKTLLSYTRENGTIFVMEPGDPRSGSLITALRAALIVEGASPLGPCPHARSCPMPGIFKQRKPLRPSEEIGFLSDDTNIAVPRFELESVVMPKKREKYPWCHLGVDTSTAPSWLESLSEEAGLPKERAIFSYLWAARGRPRSMPIELSGHGQQDRSERSVLVRVISGPFALHDGCSGQYGCSALGFTMLKHRRGAAPYSSGDLLEVKSPPLMKSDEKSGAVILPT